MIIIQDYGRFGSTIKHLLPFSEYKNSHLWWNRNNFTWISFAAPKVPVAGSESPPLHALRVWEDYISQAQARNVLIVAHSAGGAVTQVAVSIFMFQICRYFFYIYKVFMSVFLCFKMCERENMKLVCVSIGQKLPRKNVWKRKYETSLRQYQTKITK